MSEMICLMSGQQIRPKVDEECAKKLVEQLYGLRVKEIEQLNAYDDKNFHVICERDSGNFHIQNVDANGYVLKIINSSDSQKSDLMEAQTEMMLFLDQNGINCPVPVKQKSGSYFSLEVLDKESLDTKGIDAAQKHVVKLLTFKPGTLLSKVPVTQNLMAKVGHLAVKLDQVLAKFSHPAHEAYFRIWSLTSVPELRRILHVIDDESDRQLVDSVISEFEQKVLNIINTMVEGVIHADLNEQNIILDAAGENISAIIDFGDSHKSYLIFELAIVMCYMIILAKDIEIGKFVLEGYQKERALPEVEKKILKLCICARLSQSLTMGAYSYKLDPQNVYVLTTAKQGWSILRQLWSKSDDEIYRIWKL